MHWKGKMEFYDNYVNCKEALLAAGYTLWKSQEVIRSKYYDDTYFRDDGNHFAVYMNYGPGWCDLYCKINYSGKSNPMFWKDLAVTNNNSYPSKASFQFIIDKEKFMEIVCRYDYDKVEAEFRKAEIEDTLDALP